MTDQDSHRQPFGQVMESMRKYTIALILIFGAHHVNAQYGDVTILNGVSVPSDFPFIDVSILKETAPGKIFIANRFISPFMMILENDGTPYFYKRLPWSTHDFKLHSTGALTMWHGDPIYAWVELDSNFNV
ncbi:MAG: hypothetical protein IH987_13885, partial [Planctomycetes bacterium]|nr:hypothetical protein [Planctomycetota bacterium]